MASKKVLVLGVVCSAVVASVIGVEVWLKTKQPAAPDASPLAATTTTNALTTANTTTSSTKTNLFATMLAFNSNDGLAGQKTMQDLMMQGWSTLIADPNAYAKFLSALNFNLTRNAKLAATTNFSSNRDVVGAFVWNVIEPTKGTYDWSVPDQTMKAAGTANMTLSAVVQPFTNWDQTATSEATYRQNCQAIDFGYYDFKGAPPTDLAAYSAFLTDTVERYDGDGVDDMPGLTTKVEDWEIGNEVEGPCGGYANNPSAYLTLLKTSYEAIKKADPTAKVLNAGALEIIGVGPGPAETKKFWQDFFAAGGDQYLDAFNFHYNSERAGAATTDANWLAHLKFFNDELASSHGQKPLWVTEFGTYSGTPAQQGGPGQPPSSSHNLPTQSEDFQAAWYFRYAITGFANHLARMFVDLQGSDQGGIGASSLYRQIMNQQGGSTEARAFLATLQALGNNLASFTDVKQLATGQYQFTLPGKTVYALWSGSTPATLTGQVTQIDLHGTESTVDASALTFSSASPILVW